MTIYAWTVKVRGRQDVKHVTTLDELRDHLRVMDLPASRRPNSLLTMPRCTTMEPIPTMRAAWTNGR